MALLLRAFVAELGLTYPLGRDTGGGERSRGPIELAFGISPYYPTTVFIDPSGTVVTVHIGLVGQTPPQAIVRQRARGIMRRIPRKRRLAAVELMHWTYGAVGGAAFGALPDGLRRHAWAGPVYGFVTWLGFEAGVAPVLGLKQATTKQRPVERVALVADHLLYGFVLSEMRRRPQD